LQPLLPAHLASYFLSSVLLHSAPSFTFPLIGFHLSTPLDWQQNDVMEYVFGYSNP
jgi:hypothetical protein